MIYLNHLFKSLALKDLLFSESSKHSKITTAVPESKAGGQLSQRLSQVY